MSVSVLPVDEELATVFAVHYDRLKFLPISERLPAVMSKVREALTMDAERGVVHRPANELGHTAERRIRWHRLAVDRIATAFGFTIDDIVAEDTSRDVSRVRHLCAWALREIFGLSYPKAAAVLGRKDHGCVMHSMRRAQEMFAVEPAIEAKVRAAADGGDGEAVDGRRRAA